MSRVRELCPDLSVEVTRPAGWRWFLRAESGVAALALAEAGLGGEAGCERHMHRDRGHREFALYEREGSSVFLKQLHARDSGDLLRQTLRVTGVRLGYKGGLVEAANNAFVERRLEHVVRLQGFGERVSTGLVRSQALLFDALTEHDTLRRALELVGTDAAARRRYLGRALERVRELLRAGVVHLDLNWRNVMLSRDPEGIDYVVDLEQVLEVEPGRLDLIAFAHGYLYQLELRDCVSREEYDAAAIDSMAQLLGSEPSDELLRMYVLFQKRHIPRRQRLRLARVGIERLRGLRKRARRKPLPER